MNVIHERLKLADVFYDDRATTRPRSRAAAGYASDLGAGSRAADPVERGARGGGEEVVQDQQLDQRERLGAVQVGADRELAEPLRAEVAREVEARPDHLLDRLGPLALEPARDVEVHLVAELGDPDPAGRVGLAVEHRAEVGMLERRAEHELCVEVLLVARSSRQERDDDVGVLLAAGG